MQVKIRKPYEKHERVSLKIEGDTMTKQSHKDECDINKIVKKYDKTGLLTHVNNHVPQFIETSPLEFQEAMNKVIEAQNAFNELPSEIRNKFANDPAQFLEYMQNPENLEEMIKLGLAEAPEPEPSPVKVEITNPVEKVQDSPSEA